MNTTPVTVAAYYDRNTRSFLKFGRSGSALAIHRGVWAPGVTSEDEAARWINQRIGALCPPSPRLVDLGCGVGGTLVHLAERLPGLRGTGMTISGDQVAIGNSLLSAKGLADRVHLVQADFTVPWEEKQPCDVVVAVESLLHVPGLGAVLDHVAARLVPGGRLVVCDDFLEAELTSRHLEDFRRCWHAGGLRRWQILVEEAAQRGLVLTDNTNLTPWLRLKRPQDLLVRLASPVARWFSRRSPGAQNLVGGNALNALLRSGALTYRLLTFTRG